MYWIIGISVVVTAIVVVIAMNFVGPEKQLERRLTHQYEVRDPQFMREMGTLLGPGILEGNRVSDFQNGKEIFPAMLEAIEAAQRTITFETYIYWSGEVGKRFADALSRKARAGVRTHVLLDWVGSAKMDQALLDQLEHAGVEVERYHPLKWYNLSRINNRTHRKLLVVDGKVGFTGGVGIADVWDGNAQDPQHWRDAHFRIEGPAVAQMQAVFNDNWIKTTGEVLNGDEYFPPLERVGNASAHVFSSSPSGGSESMHLMYLMSIAAARKSIDLAASYMVVDALIMNSLTEAMRRGVKVRIVLPGEHTDSFMVRHASRAQWGPLLAAGAEIYEYEPTMYHCKVFIVDRMLVSVGSTNFDNRSFGLNDEANLNVYEEPFAEHLTEVFEADRERSRQVTLEMWQQRPLRERLSEKFFSLFSSQL